MPGRRRPVRHLSGEPGATVIATADGERVAEATVSDDGTAILLVTRTVERWRSGPIAVAYAAGDSVGPWLYLYYSEGRAAERPASENATSEGAAAFEASSGSVLRA
ncbi:hypothetical protein [Microbacterium lacticum]